MSVDAPIHPPWPPPGDLRGAEAPPMNDRAAFITYMAEVFGDHPVYVGHRWDSAVRMMTTGDLSGGRVLAAWLLTPRERFIPSASHGSAYAPMALPIGWGQTISAPYMVARMTDVLAPGPEDKVLEIGTGSGYQAAMLAPLCREIHTLEILPSLAKRTDRLLKTLSRRRPWLEKIQRRRADGYDGWKDKAPFDRIILTCAIDHPPQPLIDQLTPGGLMILPLGPPGIQSLSTLQKDPWGNGPPMIRDVYGGGIRVAFVPFVRENS